MAEPLSDARAPTPPVWRWYLVYCGLMALVGLAFTAGGVWGLFQTPGEEPGSQENMIVGSLAFLVTGLVLAGPFVAAFLVPREPWAWSYHLVLICLGLPTTCCMAFSLPLLIVWLDPRTKAFFGRT